MTAGAPAQQWSRGVTRVATGGPLLAGAKLYFLLAAYATTLALTWLVDPATMGQYTVVARLVAVPNMVIIQTLLFAVSRPLSGQHDDGYPAYDGLRLRGMLLSALLGGGACVIFFVGAPLFAMWLRDPDLVLPIRVVAPISAFYAFYAVNVGTLNATRLFARQAFLDVFMATTKAALIIAAAACGFGLALTIGGFTIASALALLVSIVVIALSRPPPPKNQAGAVPDVTAFASVLVVFTAAVNILLLADLAILKRFADSEVREAVVGFYSSAQMVALVPYSLLSAVALVMFPLVATLAAARDRERIRDYVSQTAKVCILLLCLMSSVGAIEATEIQALLFPRAYGSAASDLAHLVWGYSGYSFTITAAWILNSAHRTREALGLVVFVLAVVCGLAFWWVPGQFDLGAARAVEIAGALGAAAAFAALVLCFDVRVPLAFLLKVGIGVALVTFAGGIFVPENELLVVVELAGLCALFVGVVWVTGAVRIEEIAALRRKETNDERA